MTPRDGEPVPHRSAEAAAPGKFTPESLRALLDILKILRARRIEPADRSPETETSHER